EVVELDDLGDGGNVLLKVGYLLEVAAQLNKRGVSKTGRTHLQLAMLDRVQIRLDQHQVRARLDGQEATTRDVDTVGVAEVADGGPEGCLELDDANVRLAFLVTRNRLAVGDNFHLELVILDD